MASMVNLSWCEMNGRGNLKKKKNLPQEMVPLWACYQSGGTGFWYFCRCMKMIKTSTINCTGNTHIDCLTCAPYWSNNVIRAPTPLGSRNPLFLFSAFSVDFTWKCLFLWPIYFIFYANNSEDTNEKKKNIFQSADCAWRFSHRMPILRCEKVSLLLFNSVDF